MAFGCQDINIHVSVGIPPPMFCDFSLLLKVLINFNFEHQESQILSVSYHMIIEHYYNNHLIHVSALIEFLVTEILAILFGIPPSFICFFSNI